MTLRITFRFAFSYIVLALIPFPVGILPGTSRLTDGYSNLWHAIVPWVGKHIFHLANAVTVFTNGSGDTTYDYLLLLCTIVVAAFTTLVWTMLDRRRKQYVGLHEGVRVYVRYFLAFTLLTYGMAKVIKLQFISPGPERLAEPFGSFSPMGLLWYFMGYSTAYTFFAGVGETVAGVLLFFRRTTTLGALVAAGVMLNVVMLNFCYDTPVKLFSSNLLLLTVFLLVPDIKRLSNVLIFNHPAGTANLMFPWSSGWLRKGRIVLKVLVLGFAVYLNTWPNLAAARRLANTPRSPLYGIYTVETLEAPNNGKETGLDAKQWRAVAFEYPERMMAVKIDESVQRYPVTFDEGKRSMTISSGKDGGQKDIFAYARPDPEHLSLKGSTMGTPVTLELKKLDESKFLLPSRGFHWINEHPLNR